MKLKKLGLFRKTPNRFFVRKSKQSEEGGSSVKFGELTFTADEITALFTGNSLILTKDDERNQIIRENDILKITNYDVCAFKTDMKKVQHLEIEFYVCTFLTANSEINLVVIPYDGEETNYDLVLSLELIDLATEGYVQEAISQIPAAPKMYNYTFKIKSNSDPSSDYAFFNVLTVGNTWNISTNNDIFYGILRYMLNQTYSPKNAIIGTGNSAFNQLYLIYPNYQGKWLIYTLDLTNAQWTSYVNSNVPELIDIYPLEVD